MGWERSTNWRVIDDQGHQNEVQEWVFITETVLDGVVNKTKGSHDFKLVDGTELTRVSDGVFKEVHSGRIWRRP